MSNFYYCLNCKRSTDLETEHGESDSSDFSSSTKNSVAVCKHCGSEDWKAIIDTPSGEKDSK